jgi:PiT family inorganic phosphate transporter
MEHVFGSLSALQWTGLFLALGLALAFEFVNGFHDTANAVATVIYTHSLPPWVAVIWSGFCNLAGVLTSTGAVAFGVISLLPVELVINVGSGAGFAMVFALLISAIVWNLGTWYLGLPASSSHSLIGSIMGVGLMNSYMNSGGLLGGVNWAKAQDVGLSLLISPAVGFVCTAILFLLVKALIHKPELFTAPEPNKPPPWWIRFILWFTCTGVSFAHGSNDGQKGMGLLMLILVGIVPGMYALDLSTPEKSLGQLTVMSQKAAVILEKHDAGPAPDPVAAAKTLNDYVKSGGVYSADLFPALAEKTQEVAATLANQTSLAGLPADRRGALRNSIYFTTETIGKLVKTGKLAGTNGRRWPATKARSKKRPGSFRSG